IISTQVTVLSFCTLFIWWLDLLAIVENADLCLLRNCEDLLLETRTQICTNYRIGIFVGHLCPAICEDNPQVQLLFCPDMSAHNGKDCVITAKIEAQSRSLIIIKSRVLTTEELLGKELSEFQRTQTKYLRDAIPRLLSDRILPQYLSNFDTLMSLISPWPSQQITEVELVNLWLLLQDNEYVLSKSRQSNLIFPQVVSTCGHFYSVQFVGPVIDYTYFVPHLFNYQVSPKCCLYNISNHLFFVVAKQS